MTRFGESSLKPHESQKYQSEFPEHPAREILIWSVSCSCFPVAYTASDPGAVPIVTPSSSPHRWDEPSFQAPPQSHETINTKNNEESLGDRGRTANLDPVGLARQVRAGQAGPLGFGPGGNDSQDGGKEKVSEVCLCVYVCAMTSLSDAAADALRVC